MTLYDVRNTEDKGENKGTFIKYNNKFRSMRNVYPKK